MLSQLRQCFDGVFSDPTRRRSLVMCLGIVVSIVCVLAFDMRQLNRIFYKPERSLLYNVFNFVFVMFGCFAFGFIFSRLQIWVSSGSFAPEKAPAARSDKRKKKAK